MLEEIRGRIAEDYRTIPQPDVGLRLADAKTLLAEVDRLHAALSGLVEALAENDEDGLTEFAEPMCAARAALRVPDMPTHATEVDGCVVHGHAPMSDASKDAMREVIAAVKTKLK